MSDAWREAAISMWRAHCAINRTLLAEIPDAGFAARTLLKSGTPSRGRDVARVLAHMHDVRVSRLRASLRGDAQPLGSDPARDRTQLAAAFAASDAAVERWFEAVLEEGATPRGQHPLRTLAYLISHESHHRGQIALALKQSGFAPSQTLRFGIWSAWFDDADEA